MGQGPGRTCRSATPQWSPAPEPQRLRWQSAECFEGLFSHLRPDCPGAWPTLETKAQELLSVSISGQ